MPLSSGLSHFEVDFETFIGRTAIFGLRVANFGWSRGWGKDRNAATGWQWKRSFGIHFVVFGGRDKEICKIFNFVIDLTFVFELRSLSQKSK